MSILDELKDTYKNNEEILNKIEELNDTQKDFLNDYFNTVEDLIDEVYIGDKMTEFSDDNVSIYYSDIYNNLANKIDDIDDVLNEYGYNLSNFSSLNDAIVQGVQLLEYKNTLDELNEDNRIQELQEILQELNQD